MAKELSPEAQAKLRRFYLKVRIPELEAELKALKDERKADREVRKTAKEGAEE